MGIVGGPDPIVTDGLVFAVDPQNKRSYVSGSTTVTDMIGSQQLTATTIYNVPDSSYWYINSVNDVFKKTGTDVLLSFSTQITMIGWFNWQGTGNSGRIIEMYYPGATFTYGHVLALDNDGSVRGWMDRAGASNARMLELDDTTTYTTGWHMLSYTYDGSTARLYVDDNQTRTGTGVYGDLDDVSNIAIGGATATYYSDAYIGPIQVYNRALSAAEVLQNYNALKDRFV
tara:strand:- start:1 stop:687 length:687 start_codon:yes stop_codon:yes gene_type:complete